MAPRQSTKSRIPGGFIFLALLALFVLIGARSLAGWIIDYEWWKEMNQVPTWFNMMLYSVGPGVAVWLLAFVVYWISHARGMKSGGTSMGEHPIYARIATLVIVFAAIIFAGAAVDSWTVVRFFGGRGLTGASVAWRDPVFGNSLAFYLFDLPFYRDLLKLLLGLSLTSALLHWGTSRGWHLYQTVPRDPNNVVVNIGNADFAAAFESRFFRVLIAVFLSGLAVWFYFGRYELLLADHGFMVGMDWTSETIRLPLVWLTIFACLLAAGLVWAGRASWAVALVVFPILAAVIPGLVNSLYVRPNEITIQKPYIQRHIEATRSAYGLNQRTVEKDIQIHSEAKIDVEKNKVMLDNVRLWDWRAFHDTVSQIQPLRPYTFSDTDVDRYVIDGELRQVLVSPREIDMNQLGDAKNRWINPHFVYTHGYGLVLAEANRIDPNGLPQLFIRNAPPEILTPSLKLTQPELYYGEEIQEPVFVHTAQPEFNYPSGSDNVHTQYAGNGGFPISSLPMRFLAALTYGDWNILLTSQLTPSSRMMIHRNLTDRLHSLAGFVDWDGDPYLVVGNDGKLTWMVDGYLTSQAHPYSRSTYIQGLGNFNYIRNSVKATIDAYNGTVKLYVFDEQDPLINAYRNLFPSLFSKESEMPADLRAHARYPEMMFAAQAEIYRTFHMRDAEAFYNKADLWDIAGRISGQESKPQPLAPTYVVASMPGFKTEEFTLMIPFTPRNKDNLIGLMIARCDGPALGEMNVLLLSKQEVVYGPMQIEARINQDQNISKDLTLWNQQGSTVLRGQMLVLPIDGTFIYIEPIYIQAKEARMPQLKKVVVAVGNQLIYADTYDQALAQLRGIQPAAATAMSASVAGGAAVTDVAKVPASNAKAVLTTMPNDSRITEIRSHLDRYRNLMGQGKWAEAGKELEAVETLVKR